MEKEKRIRIIESDPSKSTNICHNITRMGVPFISSDDALCELHENGEKIEIIVRHLGNTLEWFLGSREIESNKFVKKVIFRGDLKLKKTFKLTSTMPNLTRVNFILGRRECEETFEDFDFDDHTLFNENVRELDIKTDWIFYKYDGNKEVTNSQLLFILKCSKVYFPKVKILELALPNLDLLVQEAERIWSAYFPKTEFIYKEILSDGIPKILVHSTQINSNPAQTQAIDESKSGISISTPNSAEFKAQLDRPMVPSLEDFEKAQSFIRPKKRKTEFEIDLSLLEKIKKLF